MACIHLPVFHHTKAFELVTGMKMTFGNYLRSGERGYNLERMVNARFGMDQTKDSLPKRLTDVPQNPNKPETKVPLEKMKKVYYEARGWDKNGLPTMKTIKRLKLNGDVRDKG